MQNLQILLHHLLPLRWDWSLTCAQSDVERLGFVIQEQLPEGVLARRYEASVLLVTDGIRISAAHFPLLVCPDIRALHEPAAGLVPAYFVRTLFSLSLGLEQIWGKPVFFGPRAKANFPRLLSADWAAVWPVSRSCFSLLASSTPDGLGYQLTLIVMPPQVWAPIAAPRSMVMEYKGCLDTPKNSTMLAIEQHHQQALVLAQDGHMEAAQHALIDVTTQLPFCAAGWNDLGYCFLLLQNFGEALTCFEQAIRLEQTKAGLVCALHNRSRALVALHDTNAAKATYDDILDLAPDDALALSERQNLL